MGFLKLVFDSETLSVELDIFKSFFFFLNEASLDPSCVKLYLLPSVLKGDISDCQKPYIWLLKIFLFYLIQAKESYVCVCGGVLLCIKLS